MMPVDYLSPAAPEGLASNSDHHAVETTKLAEGPPVSFDGSLRLRQRRIGISIAIDRRSLRDLQRLGLSVARPAFAFLLAACAFVLLIWLRRPTILSHARFWAEDGWVWYPQCYANGWHCLFIDHAGYLQTIALGVAAVGSRTIIDNFWMPADAGWLFNGGLAAAVIAGGVCCGAIALAVIACLRGPWILTAFLLFVGVELAASLTDGLAISTVPLWVQLEDAIGMRYYFHPIAAWLAVIVALLCDRFWPLRVTGAALIALTLFWAIPADWELSPLPRTNFQYEAKRFAEAPPGTVMVFPILPLAQMALTKH